MSSVYGPPTRVNDISFFHLMLSIEVAILHPNSPTHGVAEKRNDRGKKVQC